MNIKTEFRNEREKKLGYLKDPAYRTIDLNDASISSPTCPLTGIDKCAISANQHDIDMDEIPFYLRESIKMIVDRRVKIRIDEEMAIFKEEVRQKLANEKVSNQEQIQSHIQ